MRKYKLLFLFIYFNSVFAYSQTNIVIHTGSVDYAGDFGNNFYKISNIFKSGFIGLENKFLKDLSTGIAVEGFVSDNKLHADTFLLSLISPKVYLKYNFDNGYLLPENFPVSAYLIGGVSYAYFQRNIGKKINKSASVFYGLGLSLKLSKGFQIEGQSTIDAYLNDNIDGLVNSYPYDFILFNSLGLVFVLPE